MPKPYCVESAAVKVSVDELMTEMLRRVPLETVQEVLFMASQGARTRLQEKRHDRYKSEKLFRRAAKRLPEIPAHLASAVGMKVEGELKSPDITVEPVKPKMVVTLGADGVARTEVKMPTVEDHIEHIKQATENFDKVMEPLLGQKTPLRVDMVRVMGDKALKPSEVLVLLKEMGRELQGGDPRMFVAYMLQKHPDTFERIDRGVYKVKEGVTVETVEKEFIKPPPQVEPESHEIEDEPTPPPDSDDEFADLMDIPRFEDFEAVFASYPYVWETESKAGERRLVLGYASARNRDTDQLVRRNCAYTGADGVEHSFNDLPSVVGVLKKAANGVRRHLKVLPYHPGSKVRFWTNVAGSGDREDLYRFVLITEEGLEKVGSRVEFDEA